MKRSEGPIIGTFGKCWVTNQGTFPQMAAGVEMGAFSPFPRITAQRPSECGPGLLQPQRDSPGALAQAQTLSICVWNGTRDSAFLTTSQVTQLQPAHRTYIAWQELRLTELDECLSQGGSLSHSKGLWFLGEILYIHVPGKVK